MANLEDEHGFISKEYITVGTRPFGKTKDKTISKWCTLFEGSRERSRASIKRRLLEGSIGLKGGSMVYLLCVRGEDFWDETHIG